MNKNCGTPPQNKFREIIRILLITMPAVFVLLFTWFGLIILVDKLGIEISAERVLLGIAALIMGGLWAWLSLKGKMPFAKEGQSLPQPTTAQSPIEKLMRGLFVLAGIVAFMVFAMMPETMVYSFFRIFAYGRFTDTLGLLALLAIGLVFMVYHVIITIKHRLRPHAKPKEQSPYINWYLFAMINWILIAILIISFLLMVYKHMK